MPAGVFGTAKASRRQAVEPLVGVNTNSIPSGPPVQVKFVWNGITTFHGGTPAPGAGPAGTMNGAVIVLR